MVNVMKMKLPDRLRREIAEYAKKYAVERVILFGSRATGAAGEHSDVDLAVCGGNFIAFYADLQAHAHTLLTLDLVQYDDKVSDELKNEIERDGILLYEKA